MFKLFKGNKKNQLLAPLSGKIVSIEEVPDETFALKMVGDGVAVDPVSEVVLAPCDGTIGKIFKTNHAFSMLSKEGLEIFVHYGVDTVDLEGKGFDRFVEPGEEVRAGDKILSADLEYLKKNAKSVVTSVVISNMDELKSFNVMDKKEVVAGETVIIEASMK
ncbi:MAG: glucose PTS transporter subunit IIA [Victivallales bacterium]|nr:glucose PTS transporter subunit IIA [Victivallales bacterium]MCF7889222.1 glucose PTS transporter subunit IIA [Victivallales bacterium]